MTRMHPYATSQAQVLVLLVALLAVPVTAQTQDLSAQEVERALRERPGLLNERGDPLKPAPGSERYVPNEIIVRFQPGTLALPQGQYRAAPAAVVARPEITALLSNTEVVELRKVFRGLQAADTLRTLPSGEQARLPDLSQVFVLKFDAPVDVPAVVRQFNELPEVLYAEPNHLYEFSVLPPIGNDSLAPASPAGASVAMASPGDPRPGPPQRPADPFYSSQWALRPSSENGIDAEAAWAYQVGDYDVKIGIVDSGINYNHEDLGACFGLGCKVAGGYDWWSGDSDPMDESSHGSHVAGIAGALTNNYNSSGQREGIAGVAGGWGYNRQTGTGNKGAQLFALKIGGSGLSVDGAAGAAAIVRGSSPDGDGWGYGLDVLNNSWGGYGYSETLRSAFNYAARMGSVLVAAKGNDDTSALHYPSDYDGGWVISVGATNQQGGRAGFPDPGWGQPGRASNYGNGIDVVAPGAGIRSTVLGQGDASYGGTSMAAPHVSGLAALLISEARDKGITLHPEDVQGLIRASADDEGRGYHDEYGAGRINAGRALSMLHAPWDFRQTFALGGTVTSTTGPHAMTFMHSVTGSAGTYIAKRHEVRKTILFSLDYSGNPHVWCRGTNETVGWSAANPNYQTGYCEVISNTASSAYLRTYVYEVWTLGGSYLGYYPTTPQDVRFEYTVLGQPAPLSAAISGPSAISGSQAYTWTASVSGGRRPYSYLWEYSYPCPPSDPCPPNQPVCIVPNATPCGIWGPTGSGPSLTRAFESTYGRVHLRLTVTDASGTARSATRSITVTRSRPAREDPVAEATLTGEAAGAEARSTDAFGSTTSSLPLAYALTVAPNPFRETAEVTFALPEAASIRLAVYDLLGRTVARLAEGPHKAGRHRVRFDGGGLGGGVYLVRFEAEGAAGPHAETARVTLMR